MTLSRLLPPSYAFIAVGGVPPSPAVHSASLHGPWTPWSTEILKVGSPTVPSSSACLPPSIVGRYRLGGKIHEGIVVLIGERIASHKELGLGNRIGITIKGDDEEEGGRENLRIAQNESGEGRGGGGGNGSGERQ